MQDFAVVLPNVGLNESALLVFNKPKHLRNIMEDVADQTMSCIRDPVTQIISSAGDIDRCLPLGAIQPKGLNCPVTSILVSGKVKSLKFQETWFDGRPWLEYIISGYQAGCFYCRLFKPLLNGRPI